MATDGTAFLLSLKIGMLVNFIYSFEKLVKSCKSN